MDFAAAFWHLANLLAPGLGMSLIAAAATKLLWRSELRGVRLLRLWGWAALVCVGVTLAGLVVFGRDGRMATYAAMVAGCALTLWAVGFLRRG